MEAYTIVERIGEGTFGEVSKARRAETGGTVALKRVRIRSLDAGARHAVDGSEIYHSHSTAGIPPNVFREMQALKLLSHPNVVHLHECFPHRASVVLVMEYMTTDLHEVRAARWAAKRCAWDALRPHRSPSAAAARTRLRPPGGARERACAHDVPRPRPLPRAGRDAPGTSTPSTVLRRPLAHAAATPDPPRASPRPRPSLPRTPRAQDVKPSNLLLSSDGMLKLGDFGLARVFKGRNDGEFTHQVATRYVTPPLLLLLPPGPAHAPRGAPTSWYRAPELLFGARRYGPGVDLWAAGTVLAEMLAATPLFPGENDIDQIFRVVQVLGKPSVESWPVSARPVPPSLVPRRRAHLGICRRPPSFRTTARSRSRICPPCPWARCCPTRPTRRWTWSPASCGTGRGTACPRRRCALLAQRAHTRALLDPPLLLSRHCAIRFSSWSPCPPARGSCQLRGRRRPTTWRRSTWKRLATS